MTPTGLQRVIARNAPLLCLDTCMILDVARDPTREVVSPSDRKAAMDLLLAAEGASKLTTLIAGQVRTEFADHIGAVEAETARAIAKLTAQQARIDAVASVYGSATAASLSHLASHAALARAIAERWLAAGEMAKTTKAIVHAAFARMSRAATPSKRGKESMKDCTVIETYLDTARRLRHARFTLPIVFASSNTKDYANEGGSSLRPDLASEFLALNMEYAPNFGAAKHHLGL